MPTHPAPCPRCGFGRSADGGACRRCKADDHTRTHGAFVAPLPALDPDAIANGRAEHLLATHPR